MNIKDIAPMIPFDEQPAMTLTHGEVEVLARFFLEAGWIPREDPKLNKLVDEILETRKQK